MEEKLKLTDLISVDTLQRIQDAFSAMTGMSALTTDADGIPVTKGSNFTDFCMKYSRESQDGHIRCEQCDKFGAEDSMKKGGPTSYYCHAGLIDYAAPIMADDKMVGSIVGGQVLTEPPEKSQVFRTAWELGVSPQELWEAAQKVKVLEKEEIDKAADFLFVVSNALSDMAYGQYKSLQANREIERANNMKSDFLANMSHEIRTPMNAVIGLSEMALREDLPPAARAYIYQIKSSSKALLTIINDILDFSKIEAGRMDILPVEYEPMSIINDIANIAAERLRYKPVELILDISPNMPHRLFGDNIRIKQILLNLVNNATKFTSKGQVLVRMYHRPQVDGNKLFLCFDVEDTGIGIKQSDMEKIFNSFQQVDSKRNRNIEGTGLGLAISRQLAHLMGGHIYVKSEYGRGTVFSFDVPQEIVSHDPCIVVHEPEKIYAMGLLKNDYLRHSLRMDCERLGVEYVEIESPEEIRVLEDKECFLFVERDLFNSQVGKRISDNPRLTAAFLYPFKSQERHYEIPNLLMVRKPLYSLNEAYIFNREGLHFVDKDMDVVDIDVIAPEAEVLIVDDNAINLTVAEGLLEPLQMKLDLVSSGKDAVAKVGERRYDIIFMDHMMPEMDGVEATHIIRETYSEYKDVPIIAFTANAINDNREMFLREGMNDFVAKPIELKTLIAKVIQWLPPEKVKKRTEAQAVRKDGKAGTPAGKNTASGKDSAAGGSSKAPLVGDLDTHTAIKMLGSETLFWTILKNYYRMIETKADQIKKAEENEDWDNYTIEVHSLKSSSKQIGAMLLSEQAAELEKAGNDRNVTLIREKTDDMLSWYRRYLTVLEPFCREEEPKETGQEQISPERLAELFADMRAAMDDLDMDRMEEVISTMREYSYRAEQKELFERLAEATENIDVDTCEEIIVEWEKMM